VTSCAQCGASAPPAAQWCGQCYEPLPVLTTVGADQPNVAATPPPPSRFGIPVASPVDPPAAAPSSSAASPSSPPGDRLLDTRAIVLVTIAIALGGLMQLIAIWLAHHETIEPERLIRYDIVLTLGFYAVVAVVVLSQITPKVRLRWGVGPLVGRIAVGVGYGAVVSGLLLAAVSAAAGHLQPDPRIVLMMSEGDPSHILVAVLISCVAAPLVEETLFRGLLLESLLPRGVPLAVVVSALAFAVWHFMPASLVYYTAMGAALAGLYVKRGLACSIAAHVAFNGVLTAAAISVVLAPAHAVRLQDLSLTAPSGWSTTGTSATGQGVALRGPSDAVVDVLALPTPSAPSADELAARLRSTGQAAMGAVLEPASIRTQPVAGVDSVAVDIDADGHRGTLVLVPDNGESYEVVFLSAGSVKASQDFAAMLASLRLA
jgi:membrane protease YdiL (CAAX protease family)